MMKRLAYALTAFLICISLAAILSRAVFAASFSITEPTGSLTQGMDVSFTLSIDTLGETLTTAQTDLSYNTNYLQYVSVSNEGAFFPNISVNELGTGQLRIVGSVNSGDAGKNGQGIMAYVTFRILSDATGQANLCVVAAPTATPLPTATTAPTATGGVITPTCEGGICPTATVTGVTTAPTATVTPIPIRELPRTGLMETFLLLSASGATVSAVGLFLRRKK